VKLQTSDGVFLEAETRGPDDPIARVVLCHPHPQYGGTMRSIVISALFDALPQQGVACLRFNFRGVENSEGTHGEGREEPLDVMAALDAACELPATRRVPAVLVGWSFGADMALSVADDRLAAWVAIAPPLRFRSFSDYEPVADDARPKLLILAAHDEFRPPSEIEAEVASWANTRAETVAGASHFFVGRTDKVVELTGDFVRGLAVRYPPD
jgi:alpha/beta superfamily hydrolase